MKLLNKYTCIIPMFFIALSFMKIDVFAWQDNAYTVWSEDFQSANHSMTLENGWDNGKTGADIASPNVTYNTKRGCITIDHNCDYKNNAVAVLRKNLGSDYQLNFTFDSDQLGNLCFVSFNVPLEAVANESLVSPAWTFFIHRNEAPKLYVNYSGDIKHGVSLVSESDVDFPSVTQGKAPYDFQLDVANSSTICVTITNADGISASTGIIKLEEFASEAWEAGGKNIKSGGVAFAYNVWRNFHIYNMEILKPYSILNISSASSDTNVDVNPELIFNVNCEINEDDIQDKIFVNGINGESIDIESIKYDNGKIRVKLSQLDFDTEYILSILANDEFSAGVSLKEDYIFNFKTRENTVNYNLKDSDSFCDNNIKIFSDIYLENKFVVEGKLSEISEGFNLFFNTDAEFNGDAVIFKGGLRCAVSGDGVLFIERYEKDWIKVAESENKADIDNKTDFKLEYSGEEIKFTVGEAKLNFNSNELPTAGRIGISNIGIESLTVNYLANNCTYSPKIEYSNATFSGFAVYSRASSAEYIMALKNSDAVVLGNLYVNDKAMSNMSFEDGFYRFKIFPVEKGYHKSKIVFTDLKHQKHYFENNGFYVDENEYIPLGFTDENGNQITKISDAFSKTISASFECDDKDAKIVICLYDNEGKLEDMKLVKVDSDDKPEIFVPDNCEGYKLSAYVLKSSEKNSPIMGLMEIQ